MSISIAAYDGMVQRLADRDDEIKVLREALKTIAALDETHASYTAARLARDALNRKPSSLS